MAFEMSLVASALLFIELAQQNNGNDNSTMIRILKFVLIGLMFGAGLTFSIWFVEFKKDKEYVDLWSSCVYSKFNYFLDISHN